MKTAPYLQPADDRLTELQGLLDNVARFTSDCYREEEGDSFEIELTASRGRDDKLRAEFSLTITGLIVDDTDLEMISLTCEQIAKTIHQRVEDCLAK